MAPTDRRKPGSSDAEAEKASESPPEFSSRGKLVIRSSSHPPGADLPITDPPPAEMLAIAEALREKKDTPAEGPRGRRKVQAKRISAQRERDAAEASLRASEARELERLRTQDRRLWVAVAVLLAAAAAIHFYAR